MNRIWPRFTVLLALTGVMILANPGSASAVTTMHQQVYLKAWESIRDNYYDRKKISWWNRWQHKFDGRLHTRRELARALRQMVDSLGDDYTFVLSEDAARARNMRNETKRATEVRMLRENIGYIKLDNFSGNHVINDMQRALRAVASADGVILDLRGNHGGFVRIAQDVFSMLTDEGTFMTYDGFAEGIKDDQTFVLTRNGWNVTKNGSTSIRKRKPNLLGNKPLVVLVNEDTRSSAELLSGALRDNGRALIAGKQTFGKGVLQDTFNVGEHLLIKIVTAKYYLPGGTNIHETGIAPDVPMDAEGDEAVRRTGRMLGSAIAQARNSGRHVLAGIEHSRANL